MKDFIVLPRIECESRRPEWTSGAVVGLADGSLWSLPVIDLVTFMTRDLQSELTQAFGLAREASIASNGGKADLLRHARYHIHLSNLGVRLLQLNYDLPDRGWVALMDFDSLIEMLWFTDKVSTVLSEACTTHRPFLTTFELEMTDFPLIN